MFYSIKEKEAEKLISFLRKKRKVIAPVQEDIVRYKILEDNNMVFQLPFYSFKKFIMPNKEEVFEFKNNKIKKKRKEKTDKLIFIMPRCDINSFHVLDRLLLQKPVDSAYKKMRENSILIEFDCEEKKKSKYCFCESMNLIDYFDLKIYKQKGYFIEARTGKGSKLIKNLLKKKKIRFKKPISKQRKKISEKQIDKLADNFDNPLWQEYAKKCLSCGACTIVCPTCPCFRLRDSLDFNCICGARIKEWSTCQTTDFTEVAGGHVFRKDRNSRLKHRIYHKLDYFKKEFNLHMCTGCGRCIAACPTKIDMIEIIKKLK